MYELPPELEVMRPVPVEQMTRRSVLEQRIILWEAEQLRAQTIIDNATAAIDEAKRELLAMEGTVLPLFPEIEIIPIETT